MQVGSGGAAQRMAQILLEFVDVFADDPFNQDKEPYQNCNLVF